MEVVELIKKNKPNIAESSVKTYASLLINLHKEIFPDTPFSVFDFNKTAKVIPYLKTLENLKQIQKLSAILTINQHVAYKDMILQATEAKKPQTIEKKENWIESDQIREKYEELKYEASCLYKIYEATPSQDILFKIMDYIIICLVSGIFISPRRSADWTNFKIHKSTDEDNYLYKSQFIFNNYKTAKTYGQQKIECPKELVDILKKWISTNPTDYLLFDTKFHKLTSPQFTHRLNKIFGKGVGSSQMRKSFLSEKFGGIHETEAELKKITSEMGTSSGTAKEFYIKK
jgi:integrase